MPKPLGPILIHHMIYQVAIGGSRFCLVHSKTDIFTRIVEKKNTLATAWCQNIDATTTTTTLTTGEWENGVELNRAIVESLQKLWQPTISTIMMKTLLKGFSFIFVQCGNKQRRYFFYILPGRAWGLQMSTRAQPCQTSIFPSCVNWGLSEPENYYKVGFLSQNCSGTLSFYL